MRQEYKGKVPPLHTSMVYRELVGAGSLGWWSAGFFCVQIFVERQIIIVLVNRKGGKYIYFEVVCSNLSQLLGFVRIYSSHLRHLDATSPVDGLWWRCQILLLKIRVPCSHNSLLLHSLLELLCYVLSSSPPPYNPSCLFATHHNTSRFSKILQVNCWRCMTNGGSFGGWLLKLWGCAMQTWTLASRALEAIEHYWSPSLATSLFIVTHDSSFMNHFFIMIIKMLILVEFLIINCNVFFYHVVVLVFSCSDFH
jgi:hypothetical protein